MLTKVPLVLIEIDLIRHDHFVKKKDRINTFCAGALEIGVVCSRFILGSVYATKHEHSL